MSTPKSVIDNAKKQGAKMVDVKFVDTFGTAFLLKGDVFTADFLEMWISHKRKEHDALRLRPHPYEFFLYYDV